MTTYDVNNLKTEKDQTNILGYKISRKPNYSIAFSNLYRPIQSGSSGTFPSKYGTHSPTVTVEWNGVGSEPSSRFLSDTSSRGVHDLLILNNLVGREKACIVGHEERLWYVESVGPCITINPPEQKWSFIEKALSHIQGINVGHVEYARIRSILWLMESWNSRTSEPIIILLRSAFELLWEQDKSSVIDQFHGLSSWINRRTGDPRKSLTQDKLLKLFVINRNVRNFATHYGGFLGGQKNSNGESIEDSIVREMNKPIKKWKDGEPSTVSTFQTAINSHGLDKVLLSSLTFLDCVLYCFAIEWVGLEYDNICDAVDQLYSYVNDLIWPA